MSNTSVQETPVSMREQYLAADRAQNEALNSLTDPFGTDDPKYPELVVALADKVTPEALAEMPSSVLGGLYAIHVKKPSVVPDVSWPGPVPEWNTEPTNIEMLEKNGDPIVTFNTSMRVADPSRRDLAEGYVARTDRLNLATDTIVEGDIEINVWMGAGDVGILHSAAEARAAALVLLQLAEDFDRIVGDAPKAPTNDRWTGMEDLLDTEEEIIEFRGPTLFDTSAGGSIETRVTFNTDRADAGQSKAFFFDVIVQHPKGCYPITSALEDLSVEQFRKIVATGLGVLVEYDALPAVTA